MEFSSPFTSIMNYTMFQKLANVSLWSTSDLLPVCDNDVLLQSSHTHPFTIVYTAFHAAMAVKLFPKDYLPHRLKYLLLKVSQKN